MTTIPANLPPQGTPEQRSPPPASTGTSKAAATVAPSVPVPPATSGNEGQRSQAQPNAQEIKRISAELQRRISVVAPELHFSVDQSSGRPIIKITDPTTNEVIRQIPSEDILELNKALERFQKGLLVDRKA